MTDGSLRSLLVHFLLLLLSATRSQACFFVLCSAVVTCSEFRSHGDHNARPLAFNQLRVTPSRPGEGRGAVATLSTDQEDLLLNSVSLEGLALTSGVTPVLALTPLGNGRGYVLFRGDTQGQVHAWPIAAHPSATSAAARLTRQDSINNLPNMSPQGSSSLVDVWFRHEPSGLVDLLLVSVTPSGAVRRCD